MSEKVDTVFVVTQILNEELKPLLANLLPEVNFVYITPKDATSFSHKRQLTEEELNQCLEAQIILGDNCFLNQLAYKLPKLRWFQGSYAGVNIPFEELLPMVKVRGPPNFVATRFTGQAYGKLMGDYCLAYAIAHERGFIEHRDLQQSKDWKKMKQETPRPHRTMDEVTVCIIGLGSIGQLVSRVFAERGATVVGFGRSPKSEDELKGAGVSYYSTCLEDVLPKSDYIINILPETKESIGLLNGKMELCLRKPIFINVGRGSVISGTEIIKALDNGWISRAILDVFEEEPLPTTSPLWSHSRVVVTPHISAETRACDLAELFRTNYNNFVQSRDLLYTINWQHGY